MFDWFRTGVIGNGEPLPDYLFSITPWIVGGWGADDWWGGRLGDKTETINAVCALPAFTRKFSWGGGALPVPAYSFTATPNALAAGQAATLQWSVTNATQLTLNGEAVALSGTRTVSPAQTTTYVLHIVFADGTTKDLSATIAVSQSSGIPPLQWDARLDPLGVKQTRATATHAWQLVSAVYEDETQSGGNHNIYYKLQKADGSPVVGVKILVDWKDRPPGDDPAYVTTDANGEANCPLWAILHPELQDGPYFTKTVNEPSDVVSGMGLPVNRHVNFLPTFKWVGREKARRIPKILRASFYRLCPSICTCFSAPRHPPQSFSFTSLSGHPHDLGLSEKLSGLGPFPRLPLFALGQTVS